MKPPNQVLLEAAARLFAAGHPDLAQDVRQLAKRWTPEDDDLLCGRGLPTDETDELA